MQHHIIYVPGLGDPRYPLQGWALKLWRLYGVKVHYLPLGWGDGETFELKIRRLLDTIDALNARQYRVSLIGVSAGASAVLNAYAARKGTINGVVCVCGKINNPQTVSAATFKRNPAFKTSLGELQRHLPLLSAQERRKIMSIHPLRDGIVPPADTVIDGAYEKWIISIGHVFSIGCSITLASAAIIRFLKHIPQKPLMRKPGLDR